MENENNKNENEALQSAMKVYAEIEQKVYEAEHASKDIAAGKGNQIEAEEKTSIDRAASDSADGQQILRNELEQSYREVLGGIIEYIHKGKPLYIPISVETYPGGRERIMTTKLLDLERNAYYACYTSKEEASRDHHCKRVIGMELSRLLRKIMSEPDITGLMLDPYSTHRLILGRDTIDMLLQAEKEWH